MSNAWSTSGSFTDKFAIDFYSAVFKSLRLYFHADYSILVLVLNYDLDDLHSALTCLIGFYCRTGNDLAWTISFVMVSREGIILRSIWDSNLLS